jgi:hypothetical protein
VVRILTNILIFRRFATLSIRLLCVWTCCAYLAAQEVPTPSAPAEQTPLERVVATARVLQDFHFTKDIPDNDVSERVRPLLTDLKHGLRDWIGQLLNDSGSRNPKDAEKAAIASLMAASVYTDSQDAEYGSEEDKHPYGWVEELRIEQPKDNSQLLAVTTTIGLNCGNDTSLYVFQRRSAAWELVLAQEANDYADVGGAHGSFQYAISALEPGGGWYVATANINPWCSSMWQAIRFQVLRPGVAPYAPRILLDQNDTIYLGMDEGPNLALEKDRFRLSWFGGSIAPDVLIRVHVAEFEIGGYSAVRIPPYAVSAQDFIDEWLTLPWEEAEHWTRGKLGEVKYWHDRLHHWYPSPDEWIPWFICNRWLQEMQPILLPIMTLLLPLGRRKRAV